MLAGLISYFATNSFAIFANVIESDNNINVVVELPDYSNDSNVVYSYNIEGGINLGTALESINEYTSDYTTLNKSVFLKHNIGNNNTVETQDVCYILNSEKYCLKGGTGDYYEENKLMLLEIFGVNNCSVNSNNVLCSSSGLYASAADNGSVYASDSGWYCTIHTNGYAECIE